MKFSQLVHGASFEFRGVRYRKVSAIEAINAESGQRKLIPRSAPVDAVDAAVNVIEDRATEAVNRTDLEAALATCWSTLRRRVRQDLLADDAELVALFDQLLMQTQRELRADLLSRADRDLSKKRTTTNEVELDK